MSRNILVALLAALFAIAAFTTNFTVGLKGTANTQGAALLALKGDLTTLQATVNQQGAAITTLQGNVTTLQNTVNTQGAALLALQGTANTQGAAIELLQKQLGDVKEHSDLQGQVLERHHKRVKQLESFARRKACENRPEDRRCKVKEVVVMEVKEKRSKR